MLTPKGRVTLMLQAAGQGDGAITPEMIAQAIEDAEVDVLYNAGVLDRFPTRRLASNGPENWAEMHKGSFVPLAMGDLI